jgi:GcrA cell cycle regulator
MRVEFAYGQWTPERIAQLTELWLDGRTCSQIAMELGGVTRNAVIGKVHRLKLPPRKVRINPYGLRKVSAPLGRKPQPMRPKKPPRVKPMGIAFPPEFPPLPERLTDAWEPLPDRFPLPLIALSDKTCRWPVGGDDRTPGIGFCGCTVMQGRTYCPEHYATSIGKGTPSERGAVKAAKVVARLAA